ncbi:hypothetical protein FS837_007061 [Tulasnella sp. UAMH 9824]|nr:hypothetical protein FS837_007061 [Tulasnella sp. UAMH 9824]
MPSRDRSSGFWTQILHLNRDRYFHNPVGNAFTLFDPSEAGNAAIFQNAIDRILQHLAETSISDDVSIVLGLTDGAPGIRKVTYYLVNNESQVVFWLEDTTRVILRLCPGHIADCLRTFFLYEYWRHIQHFPPTSIDLSAENDLKGRLLAAQVSEYLSPWTPDECRHFLATLEYNQIAKSERDRMADIGLLLLPLQTINNMATDIIATTMKMVDSETGVLLDLDRPLGISMAYSVMLTGVNKNLGLEGRFNDLYFLTSLTFVIATLLICFISPALCLFIAAGLFENPANARLRNWIVSSFMAFNVFVYGCLLSAFGQYLEGPEHHHSMAGLVLVTFVLALPPAFHALRLSYDLD